MAMEARLSLRQSQRVVMTPLLQQAIQLLQLSTLELQEVVQKELLENPLLEEVTPDTPETPADAPVTADTPPAPTVEQLTTEAPPSTERQTDELPFDFTAVMSADDDHEERSLVSQEDREDLPFENVVRNQVSLTDHLEEQLRFATEDPVVRRIGTEIIGNLDEDGYLRAELEELAQRCSVTAEEVGKVLILVQGFDPPGGAAHPGVFAAPAAARPTPGSGLDRDHRGPLRRPEPPSLHGHRAGDEALGRPHHGVGRGDHGARAEAGAALRRQRLALHRPRRLRLQARERVHDRPQRGRRPAAAGELALPLAAEELRRRRGQAIRGAEAALGPLADQERRPAAAHPAKSDAVDRQIPARLPRPGAAVPETPVPAGRGRGHRHARVDDQPRDDQQVRRDATGPLRAEVLLPQRDRVRRRGDGLVGLGQEDDPGSPGDRRPGQAAIRPGGRAGAPEAGTH